MDFKKWLLEWEGNNFSQEKDLVNDTSVQNSKYKGPGPKEPKNLKTNLPAKTFGFKPKDMLLKIQKPN